MNIDTLLRIDSLYPFIITVLGDQCEIKETLSIHTNTHTCKSNMFTWFVFGNLLSYSYIFIIVFFALQNAVSQKGNEVNLTLGGIDLNNSGRLACFLQLHIILFNVYVHILKIAGL